MAWKVPGMHPGAKADNQILQFCIDWWTGADQMQMNMTRRANWVREGLQMKHQTPLFAVSLLCCPGHSEVVAISSSGWVPRGGILPTARESVWPAVDPHTQTVAPTSLPAKEIFMPSPCGGSYPIGIVSRSSEAALNYTRTKAKVKPPPPGSENDNNLCVAFEHSTRRIAHAPYFLAQRDGMVIPFAINHQKWCPAS